MAGLRWRVASKPAVNNRRLPVRLTAAASMSKKNALHMYVNLSTGKFSGNGPLP